MVVECWNGFEKKIGGCHGIMMRTFCSLLFLFLTKASYFYFFYLIDLIELIKLKIERLEDCLRLVILANTF